MRVLVTGGAGYIGSHTVLTLIEKGHEPIVVDNLSNSSFESIKRVQQLTGKNVEFYELDVLNPSDLSHAIGDNPLDGVIHFAGYKAVGESVEQPLKYYRNNLDSILSVLEYVQASSHLLPPKFIFSSSATVYGIPSELPITEEATTGVGITNPYGFSKFVGERILEDTCNANPAFQAIALRYFNPIGSHESGMIGEDPLDIPNNIAPYITQVASGKLKKLSIFGGDYQTQDGTGVRDYIHVMDLAEGHVAALDFDTKGFHTFNLGTGRGTSVLELHAAFEEAANIQIPFEIVARREGDIASSFANISKAKELLKWESSRTVSQACVDAWRWQSTNPTGY